jgi:hypothetical protein
MHWLIRYASRLYELLFSIYWAGLLVSKEALKEGSEFLDALQSVLLSLDHLLNSVVHGAIFANNGAKLFYGSWALLAVIILVSLEIFKRIARKGMFVYYAVGILTVAGPLYSGVYASAHMVDGVLLRTNQGHLAIDRWVQWLEVIVVAVCVSFYLYWRWPANAMWSVLLLTAHFGFWGLVLFGGDWRDFLWQVLVFLLLPLGASMVWTLCGGVPTEVSSP